jgi:hypothetical protein
MKTWLLRLGSIPAGFFSGGLLAGHIFSGMLHAEGKGNSHADLTAMSVILFYGGIGGALLFLIIAWIVTIKIKR